MERAGVLGLPEGRESRDEDYFSRQDSSSASRLAPPVRRMQSESIRPRLSSVQSPSSPTSPRTPRTPLLGRSISSTFNSPGPVFRADDDFFVFEFGSRYLRAGVGGQARPRCRLGFGPDASARVGDHSQWLSPQASKSAAIQGAKLEAWGSDHELWSLDVRDVDLGLVTDKLERSLRTAIAEYLLVLDDSKKRKFMLILPPTMPHPLLSTLLTAVFNVFPPPPSVVLLSSPVLSTIAAGLRSALIVDIGWTGTLVTAVYEYREVKHKRSCRGMKLLSWQLRNTLNIELQKLLRDNEIVESVSIKETEEILSRMVWCRTGESSDISSEPATDELYTSIPLQSRKPPQTLTIPFNKFARPPETALFGREESSTTYDDHELPLHVLMYGALLSLPVDIRQACLPRIIITGGGSCIPGLKSRLINELSTMVASRGWDPVHNYGSAKKTSTRRTTLRPAGAIPVNEKLSFDAQITEYANKDVDPNSAAPAYLQPPLPDPILAAIQSRSAPPGGSGEARKPTLEPAGVAIDEIVLPIHARTTEKIRSIKTLGAWQGASLVASLRARGLVEIDRDKFLQHGLNGAIRTADSKRQSVMPVQAQRQSLVGISGAGALGAAWTLGAWA